MGAGRFGPGVWAGTVSGPGPVPIAGCFHQGGQSSAVFCPLAPSPGRSTGSGIPASATTSLIDGSEAMGFRHMLASAFASATTRASGLFASASHTGVFCGAA